MKAPKNFYNTVDQSKLGIDDLFTRTAENESDIAALETVVGDLDGGLVKDVHDLQDASEQYHDDIADLKTADVTLGLRIDDLSDDIEPHLYYDVDATSVTSPASTLTFSKPVNEIVTDIRNSGKVPRLRIAIGTNEIDYVYLFRSVSTGFVFGFTCIAGMNSDVFYNQVNLLSSNTTTSVTATQKKLT